MPQALPSLVTPAPLVLSVLQVLVVIHALLPEHTIWSSGAHRTVAGRRRVRSNRSEGLLYDLFVASAVLSWVLWPHLARTLALHVPEKLAQVLRLALQGVAERAGTSALG